MDFQNRTFYLFACYFHVCIFQNTESEAVCVCSPLWSGRMCEQRIHPCDDHNCGMGSFCNEDVNNVKSGYKCIGMSVFSNPWSIYMSKM